MRLKQGGWTTMAGRVLATLAVPVMVACGDPAGPDVEPITELPRALTNVEEALIGAANDFGLELLGEVVAREEEKPNVLLSPLSASMALGMTLNGAAGDTWDAMRGTLGYGDLTQEEINAAYGELLQLLEGLDETVELSVANSVWARDGFPFHDAFFQAVTQAFDARVENRDFADPATLTAINDWVNDETNGYIPRLLDEIKPEMVMFLVNAIYFDGQWTTRFDRDETVMTDFRRADDTTVSVPMMSLEEHEAPAVFAEDYAAAELTYGGGAFGMVVVVPQGVSAAELAAGADAAWWEGLTSSLVEREVDRIALPRFTFSYGTELNDALSAMGMEVAFDPNLADFSALSPEPGGLYIDEVRQKAFIQVDEAGTKAAAATSVGVGVTSLPPQVVADRPFLFFLRERLSGTILFAGLVGDPTVEE